MFIKTVSTTSGINPIKFDETGGVFYWILNTGSSTVYASTKSTFTAGDDGVVSLGPKESRRLETNNDTIYILGEGQVEIHNQRDGICSFKQAPTSSGGGETIDAYTKTESDAKYAAKSDVPDAYTKTESDDKYAQKIDVVPYKMGMDFGTCTTAAETVVKSVTTMHKVAPALGAVFAVKFNNAVPAQARLNINGLTGYIQYRGDSIPNGVINAGDIATFIYYSSSGFNIFEILSVENNGNAKTVNGHTVNADVPENAVFTDTVPNLSEYMKKIETITIGNAFTPFPRQVDINGKMVYGEYTRKKSDGTADKLFRIMGDPDAPSYSDFQAHYDGQNVIWYFNGTELGVSVKIGGKAVITEATAVMQEFGVTPTLSNSVKTDVVVSFNPKIVLLFNNGHIITGGYSITMGTKKFSITPSAVSTMGTVSPNYIAFG